MEYQNYAKMIQKQAWKWHKKANMEFDDAIGEGNLSFTECLPLFDSKKGQFSTLLFSTIENRFKNIIIKNNQAKYTHTQCEFIEECHHSNNDNQEKRCIFKNTLNVMSKEAKEVVSIIFDAPSDLLNMIPKTKLSMHQLTKYLTKKGWKKKTINKTINEIKLAINS